MSYQQEKFKEIADAIREKTGTNDLIKPSEFAEKIDDVYAAGQNSGGGGYDEGFEEGKEAEKREQWDAKIAGLQKGWTYGFAGKGVNDETFTPYTDIRINSGYNIMNLFAFVGITDLKGIMERYGVSFDLTLGASAMNLFSNAKCTRIPKLPMGSTTNINTAFDACTDLVSIDEIYAPEITSCTNAFRNCTSLEELRITSEIKINGLDLHWSPLSKESIESIVEHLSSTMSGLTVTFNASKIAEIDSAEGGNWWENLKNTRQNWTFALADIKEV